VNSAQNRANFCKDLDGNPPFSALYVMYAVTLNELKVVLKVSSEAGKKCYSEQNFSVINDPGRRLPGSKEQPPAHAGSSFADFSTLKIEAIHSSETYVHTRSTRRDIPEDSILHSHRREYLRSYIKF
jgi:hypothetical protein